MRISSPVSIFPIQNEISFGDTDDARAPGPRTDLDGGIVRPGRENVVIQLQASHTISVALERLNRASAVLPVVPDL